MSELIPTSKQLHDFIDDLEKCLNYEFKERIDCDNIVLCGMGGSAISGNVVADYCLRNSSKQIVAIMNTTLPNWINERTLVIISSYSGNTLETLESYRQILDVGCKRVVITAGGILEKLAKKNGDPLIMLPDNLHPRHSIGYMIGYIFGVIRATGCIGEQKDILECIESLRGYRDGLEDKENGLAIKLARQYIENIPIICSYSDIQSIIFRWKTQFNENSKYVAFCTTALDLYYSDVRWWSQGCRSNYTLTVILDKEGSISNDVSMSKMLKYLDDNKIKYTRVALNGHNGIENMFRALMLGDYISMYMAEIQDIDPSGVPPITLLKTKLKPLIEERTKDLL
ncbi:MAG: hypothetical protein J5813_04520 [Candidatus Methanomethylophilaceae archaeon]|nr:hypothetical protein [Candidatus Methanomethylophilaceae archaeon]